MFLRHVLTGVGPFTGKHADVLFELQIVPRTSKSDNDSGQAVLILDFCVPPSPQFQRNIRWIKFPASETVVRPQYNINR